MLGVYEYDPFILLHCFYFLFIHVSKIVCAIFHMTIVGVNSQTLRARYGRLKCLTCHACVCMYTHVCEREKTCCFLKLVPKILSLMT